MAYKTVRRNGRDVLINTKTGKEVGAGQRVANELAWMGKGITDNFTYSDKVDKKSGRRLTPAEVRRAEGKPTAKPAVKAAAKPAAKPAQSDAAFDKKYGTNDPRNNLARKETGKTPAPAPRPAGTQPSRPAARPAASRPSTPAATKKPAAAPSGERRVSAATANRESGNYGTSRTDNKMIDDWMRQKMREREGRDLTSKGSDYGSKAMSKQFASKGASADTGYTPKTKADGSKYAGKQPTNETKTAYDSKTNLKPSAPSKPATPNEKPDVKYKPSTKVDGSKYSGKKPENRTQLAFKSKGAESLAEMMRKRRQG